MTVTEYVKRYRVTRREALEGLAQAALDAGITLNAQIRDNAVERTAEALMSELRVFSVKELAKRAGLTIAAVNTAVKELQASGRVVIAYRALRNEAPGPRPMLYGAAHNHPLNVGYKL